MATESSFVPTWRYNPLKHELQFWFSPTQAACYTEPVLKVLEKLPIMPVSLQEAVQAMQAGKVDAIGGWRNCSHEGFSKLPISTR